jgi:hypothetical protein
MAAKSKDSTAKQAQKHSIASRLNAASLRSAIRPAFQAMWTIQGTPGLYGYVRGCKADYKPKKDEIVAQPDLTGKKVSGVALAVFKRDAAAEQLVLDAVGVKAPKGK